MEANNRKKIFIKLFIKEAIIKNFLKINLLIPMINILRASVYSNHLCKEKLSKIKNQTIRLKL